MADLYLVLNARTSAWSRGILRIKLVVALGNPCETVVLEDAKDSNDIDYWRDIAGIHHVPKRPLSELLVEL
jgi:hypothetical protein